MAYLVRRPKGRWEIRESYLSSVGPRARTLATFRALSPEILQRASKAARSTFDADGLVRAARRNGVPFERSPGDEAAAVLIRRLARGAAVRPGLGRLIVDRLGDVPDRAIDDSVTEWIGASVEQRGDALVDLLGLADRLPQRPRGPLRFPGLSPERLRR